MFSGIAEDVPVVEYDAPDRPEGIELAPNLHDRAEDLPTLRVLEGRSTPDPQSEAYRGRQEAVFDMERDSSDEEDAEMAQATLISFDVEATESMDNSLGGWSAELRSANEQKPTAEIKYHVTGLTLLPTILATEGLREIIAGVLVIPMEALMVRIIAKAYRKSAGLSTSDIYGLRGLVPAFENLLTVFTLHLALTGLVWAGFSIASQWWAARKYPRFESKSNSTRMRG